MDTVHIIQKHETEGKPNCLNDWKNNTLTAPALLQILLQTNEIDKYANILKLKTPKKYHIETCPTQNKNPSLIWTSTPNRTTYPKIQKQTGNWHETACLLPQKSTPRLKLNFCNSAKAGVPTTLHCGSTFSSNFLPVNIKIYPCFPGKAKKNFTS